MSKEEADKTNKDNEGHQFYQQSWRLGSNQDAQKETKSIATSKLILL